ncbi:peptidoglycan-binding protein [Candidatus Woesebacteria bacterium]|nr:peptidoglycan-binding protein [Candidatus Woesebacteria bacterium]
MSSIISKKTFLSMLALSMISVAVVASFASVTTSQTAFAKPPVPSCQANDFAGYPMLQMGSTGQKVKKLQKTLNSVGSTPVLVANGVFGQQTKKSVKNFQTTRKLYRCNGTAETLQIDGIVGPKTWKALYQAVVS